MHRKCWLSIVLLSAVIKIRAQRPFLLCKLNTVNNTAMMSEVEPELSCSVGNDSMLSLGDTNHNTVNSPKCDRRDTASLDSGCDSSHFTNGHSKTNSTESGASNQTDSVICRRKHILNGDTQCELNEARREKEILRRRSASILEVKEHAHARLREELLQAQQELKLKDEECKRLNQVQDQMNEELEELTAKLFEEANKMVQDANIKRMNTEKLYNESKAKIEVLQAEVTALKTLVITSTPSMPNKHLHPQLGHSAPHPAKEFVKGHRRSTSHHNLNKEMRSWEVPLAPLVDGRTEEVVREVDPVCFEEFHTWRLQPSLCEEGQFLSQIIKDDIRPCMAFSNTELAENIYRCVLDNTLTIEPMHERNPFPKKCSLTQATRICKYRVKLTDCEPYHSICLLARNRIAAVCDFITYIRYIVQGLVKSDESGMYWEIVRLRKKMSLARLGLS